MAELVKWLTRRIVAPVCMGSIPIFRPILDIITLDFFQGFYFIFLIVGEFMNERVTFIPFELDVDTFRLYEIYLTKLVKSYQ